MANYALLDENNVVQNIIYVEDSKDLGEEYTTNNLHSQHGGNWKKYYTNLEDNPRYNPASIGSIYDPSRDAFISVKQHDDMILNNDTLKWEFPIPEPDDGNFYEWNTELKNWVLIQEEDE